MKSSSEATWQEWNSGVNLNRTEGFLSIAGGVLLALMALSRRFGKGWIPAALGAFLLQRGITRRCPIYQALGINSSDVEDDIFEILPVEKRPETN